MASPNGRPVNEYSGWLNAVEGTEDATAVLLDGRDAILNVRLLLGAIARRHAYDDAELAKGNEDLARAMRALTLALEAAKAHRGSLRKPIP